MTDEELVAAFESAALPGDAFTHEAHVRVAWWYLRHASFSEALARFSIALRRFAAHLNASGKYHETITVAYMALVAERMENTPGTDWTAFREAHADLIARRPSILSDYYSDATLQSSRARRTYVLPDRLPARQSAG
jgi:hypothetical protein